MLSSILGNIICEEFTKNVGRGQASHAKPCGLLLPMASSSLIEGWDEQVYNHTDLLLYADYNYVGVYTRERWNPKIEGGPDGHDPWSVLCYHDSCWRNEVGDFFFKNRDRLIVLDTFVKWYEEMPITPDVAAELKKARDDKYNRQ